MEENKQGHGQTDNEKNFANKGKSRRGFASMNPEEQRGIASKGGQAAHQQGVAHEWTSEEARAAGRKGGQASSSRRNAGGTNMPVRDDSADDSNFEGNERGFTDKDQDPRSGDPGEKGFSNR